MAPTTPAVPAEAPAEPPAGLPAEPPADVPAASGTARSGEIPQLMDQTSVEASTSAARRRHAWRISLSANRYPPRIKFGAGRGIRNRVGTATRSIGQSTSALTAGRPADGRLLGIGRQRTASSQSERRRRTRRVDLPCRRRRSHRLARIAPRDARRSTAPTPSRLPPCQEAMSRSMTATSDGNEGTTQAMGCPLSSTVAVAGSAFGGTETLDQAPGPRQTAPVGRPRGRHELEHDRPHEQRADRPGQRQGHHGERDRQRRQQFERHRVAVIGEHREPQYVADGHRGDHDAEAGRERRTSGCAAQQPYAQCRRHE